MSDRDRRDDRGEVEGCPDDDTELVELPDEPGTRMSKRMHDFCEAYLRHGNGTRAAREAGYPDKHHKYLTVQAIRLLRNLKVRTYLDARMPATVDEKLVTTIIHREAMTADHAGARVRAAELSGKQLGMYSERHKHEFMESIPDELLAEKLAAGDPVLKAIILKRLAGEGGPDLPADLTGGAE